MPGWKITTGIQICSDTYIIKPFHTRQVAVRDCKPYKAETEEQKVIDPIILDQFLSKLNLDNNEEILSVIDKDIDTESVTKFDYRSSISRKKNIFFTQRRINRVEKFI